MRVEANPGSRAGALAIQIYEQVLEEVRADRLVEQFASLDGDFLKVQDQSFDLSRHRRILVAAAGKASIEMARAIQNLLGDRLNSGLVITKRGYGKPMERLEVLEAGHPVPDESSLEAGRRMLQLAQSCSEEDLVIFLLSGGASALMELPVAEVTLQEIQDTNRMLLASGADIALMNAVRSHISRLKAGGLARAFGSASVVALVLSDVIGNSLATIRSGPLIAPHSEIAIPTELLDRLPESVRREVLSGELLPKPVPVVPHFVIGSVSVAIHAAASAARDHGLDALPYLDPMQGEAREMARRIMTLAKRHVEARPTEAFCMIFGGETTVALRGTGLGGRAQEMAVAAAPQVARISNLAFLAAGTDGTDGPTEAAGGLVETDTLTQAKAADQDPRKALVTNDSYHFLKAINALILTGPTGSNVNDLCLVVHAP